MDECLVVGSPVDDFELLFCHGISLQEQEQECGIPVLITAKSSIKKTDNCAPLRIGRLIMSKCKCWQITIA